MTPDTGRAQCVYAADLCNKVPRDATPASGSVEEHARFAKARVDTIAGHRTERARTCPQSAEGTVNLIGSGRDKAHEGRSHERLYLSGHAGDLGGKGFKLHPCAGGVLEM